MNHRVNVFKLITALIIFLFISCQTSGTNIKREQQYPEKKTPMRGLYIPNRLALNYNFMKKLVQGINPVGINMLVLDVHRGGNLTPRINQKVIQLLISNKIYIAARVVCFQDGLKQLPVPETKMQMLYDLVDTSVKSGFNEIQLDYIRFHDGMANYSLQKKYSFIDELLNNFKKYTSKKNINLSADIFGRIVYNKNDTIGQQLELFAKHTNVIYPMLYPSHFTGDTYRMANPGETVKEGILKGLERLKGKNVHIHAFIQAFPYNTQYAHVPLSEYVALQITAVESTNARGWVAWNAYGDYAPVINALKNIMNKSSQVNLSASK